MHALIRAHTLSACICPTFLQKEPVVVVEELTAMANAVRLTCPVCGHSVAFREADGHLAACLQEVCSKDIHNPVTMEPCF